MEKTEPTVMPGFAICSTITSPAPLILEWLSDHIQSSFRRNNNRILISFVSAGRITSYFLVKNSLMMYSKDKVYSNQAGL